MKGREHLTKPEHFALVHKNGSSTANTLLVMRALPNKLDYSRYGFSVSKYIGKSVIRNRIKRLLREILRNAAIKPGWDIVFIVRRGGAASGFAQLKEAVLNLLIKKLLMAENNEKYSSGNG